MATTATRQPPRLPPPAGYQWQVDFSTTVGLTPGQEWHSEPFPVSLNETLVLQCSSGVRFYAGFPNEGEYLSARTRSPLWYPFQRGTDRTAFEQAVRPGVPELHRIVLRIGAFARPGTIYVSLWKAILVPEPERPAPGQDKVAEMARTKRGRRIFIGVGIGIAIIAVWITWFDAVIFLGGNFTLFDATLDAEATAVLAILAVLGGLFALWRELFVKPPSSGK